LWISKNKIYISKEGCDFCVSAEVTTTTADKKTWLI